MVRRPVATRQTPVRFRPSLPIKHIIATRFLLPVNGVKLDNKWITERKRLLFRYAAPSIAQQHRNDFVWLLISGLGILPHKKEIESRTKAKVVIAKDGCAHKALASWIRSRVRTPWVLTTRFDSDDLLHSQFVQELRVMIQPGDSAVSFGNGWLTNLTGLRRITQPANAFASLLERNAPGLRTVYHVPHGRLGRSARMRVLPQKQARWLVLQHEEASRGVANGRGFKATGQVRVQDLRKIAIGFPFSVWRDIIIQMGA